MYFIQPERNISRLETCRLKRQKDSLQETSQAASRRNQHLTTMDRHYGDPEPMDIEESNQNNNNILDDEEKRRRRRKHRLDKEELRANIVKRGNLFILFFKNLLMNTKACKEVMGHYMERVLHSIFFFGQIYSPPILPEEFLPERQIEQFKKNFPKPFREYNTHLPYYTPYSFLLEYMTEGLQPEDPHALMEKLVTVNASLWKYSEENQPMIAISALHVWDRAVSYAVCCAGNGPPITYEHTTREDCAENESFSRLLQREEICIRDGEKLMNREDIENTSKEEYEDETRRKVSHLLTSRKFLLNEGEWKFFTSAYLI